jgi:K+-transporting ATPase KdpF subunit
MGGIVGDVVALLIAVALIAYLVVAMLFPERF